MKRSILLLSAVVLVLSAGAQVRQEVIASAGGHSTASGISLSWTLGETIIPTFTSSDLILTHGFQQQIIITPVRENLKDHVKVTVFPNPVTENVNITFGQPVEGKIQVLILNSAGNLIKTDFIEPVMTKKQFNLQDLPAGIYFFRLVKGNLTNVYKVVKL